MWGGGENFFRGWEAFSCTHVLSERSTMKSGREKCDQRSEMRRWTEGVIRMYFYLCEDFNRFDGSSFL